MRSDLFGINGLKLSADIYGLSEPMRSGLLPEIEAAVNAQEVFESRSSIARRWMRLEGEKWNIEFASRELTIWASGFVDCREIEKGVSFFMSQIKDVLHCHFWAGDLGVTASWPLEPNPQRKRTVGQILQSKASKITASQLDELPGEFLGSGVALMGMTDDYIWQFDAGPVGDHHLIMSADLTFPEPGPQDWPKPEDEIRVVTGNIAKTYEFMEQHGKAFIEALMP